jgi:AraC family transcriptional regulator
VVAVYNVQLFVPERSKISMLKTLPPGSYYGKTKRGYDLGGLTLSESVFPSRLVIPRHQHANSFFCFILEGSSTTSWERQTWIAEPSTLTLFPAGLAHANRWDDSGGRVLNVEFDGPWLQRLHGSTAVLERAAEYEGGPLIWLAHRLLEEYRHQDAVSPLAIEGLTLELLAQCVRSSEEINHPQPPRWLERAKELLRDCFTENLSLCEIALAVGISADHLARAFRRFHGCTVGEYVRRLRVEYASRCLASSELPLVQIALDAGFTDQSHFTKTFKRNTGVTPAVFRDLHRRRMSRTKG